MKGKTIVFVIIIFTIVVLAIGWIWILDIMAEYDLERPNSIINGLH
ncbi:hypothetical protein [Oceanobacillus profundus]|nr:hypothetical protein [Oceanobacillus profundus]MDO6449444.1 hypothetical protein [Oceanobacillus profundus]